MNFNLILVPTCLHVGSKKLPASRLGCFLGSLERVLGRLGRILKRLGGILEHLGASWARLGRVLGRFKRKKRERGPGFQLCLAAGKNFTELYRPLQTSTDHLTTHLDTQLGAFGPGADPQRSKAANPPPRF